LRVKKQETRLTLHEHDDDDDDDDDVSQPYLPEQETHRYPQS